MNGPYRTRRRGLYQILVLQLRYRRLFIILDAFNIRHSIRPHTIARATRAAFAVVGSRPVLDDSKYRTLHSFSNRRGGRPFAVAYRALGLHDSQASQIKHVCSPFAPFDAQSRGAIDCATQPPFQVPGLAVAFAPDNIALSATADDNHNAIMVMATLIGDVFADSSRFHSMIGGHGMQHQHTHEPHYQNRSVSRSRDRDLQQSQTRPTPSPRRQSSTSATGGERLPQGRRDFDDVAPDSSAKATPTNAPAATGSSASRFPSPPPSSSPSDTSSTGAQPQNAIPEPMSSAADPSAAEASAGGPSTVSSASTTVTVVPAAGAQPMPSPESDHGGLRYEPNPPIEDAAPDDQMTIHVKNLDHIQHLAQADMLAPAGPGILNDPPLQQMKYEISAMPIGDIIEMVAALLTKITTTNDLQHDALNRNAHHQKQANDQARSQEAGAESGISPLSSSVLAFHGKNVPGITILSYLLRIHKYCPTTYEVFLSLLVYFDRMTERVNDMVMKNEEARRVALIPPPAPPPGGGTSAPAAAAEADTVMQDDDDDEDPDLTDSDDITYSDTEASKRSLSTIIIEDKHASTLQSTYFVVDSFNIHRLIISGVTCASKFFSDVFYTNSRYAKVGGLPLAELNHLELQFLLLNDFRLAVPVEDLEAYATMLVEFYAREIVSQRSRPAGE